MNKSIVVSHYKEDLSWLSELPNDIKVYLYTKGDEEIDIEIENDIEIEKLENIGNEQHTYFHHIVENFNNLEDYIIFSQGDPYEHSKFFNDKINNNFIGGLSDFNLITSLYGKVDNKLYKKHINHKYENINYDQINNNIFIDPWNDENSKNNINYIIDNLPIEIKKENWIFNANGLYSTTNDKIKELDFQLYKKCYDLFYDDNLNMTEFAFERINQFILIR